MALAVAGCLGGLLAGARAGALWLDESISVAIARLPLLATGPDSLYGGLRQDGAPPLYYLLLRGWTSMSGAGAGAVRLLTVLTTLVALALAYRVGSRLGAMVAPGAVTARAGGRVAVTALAALPWTMRFGSETRMYVLVVVLVLLGVLAVLSVHRGAGQPVLRALPGLAGLSAVVGLLLYTHYWSLFLLAAVGAWHLPGLLQRGGAGQRRVASIRVLGAMAVGGLTFLPWLPTFFFQAQHTGAPWADPLVVVELLRTPRYWGSGPAGVRTVFALLLMSLVLVGLVRSRAGRPMAAIAGVTLLLAFLSVLIGGGAYTGRYTAVVVPLVAVLVGLGAMALPRRWSVLGLGVFVVFGLVTGIPGAANSRTAAPRLAAAYTAAAGPGELLASCPDQMAPDIARLLPTSVPQVVYPSLGPPERIDWVDYKQRQDDADPAAVAAQISARAGAGPMFLLSATEYRTFEGDCEVVRSTLARLRGAPTVLFGEVGTTGRLLYRYGPPRN